MSARRRREAHAIYLIPGFFGFTSVGAVSYSSSRVYMYGKPAAGWISGNETTQAVQSDGVLGDGFCLFRI
jgi:hypothetical protein